MPTSKHEPNGVSVPLLTEKCPIADEWFQHRQEVKKTLEQVDLMHSAITQVVTHTSHLQKLDIIASATDAQCRQLNEIRDGLMGPATSKKQMDNETVLLIVKILGAVIIGLLFTIVFILTGQKFGLFTLHG